jgi:site-specific recombinase XerD
MMRNPTFVSALADRFYQFVRFRRLGRVDGGSQIQLLEPFDRFLNQEGFQGRWATRDMVDRYVATTEHLHPGSRANRLSLVRQFCRYLRQFEPDCYVPERILAIERRPTRIPHIYTEDEIKAILAAARDLPPPGSLRPKTYSTLFGLLYTTGLRCGEAFALNLDNVDLDRSLLYIRKGKFSKSRCVPISPSTSVALQKYVQERARVASTAAELPLFLTRTGRRVYHTNADFAFRQVLTKCGLRGGRGCPGPRMHDLRHSFACTRLLKWYREGKDVQTLLPALATYLGHVNVSSTQVYLRATAELLEEANERFLTNVRQNVLKKG